jgi:branched-chain amino acid transport system ATP-binding protein/neutral amino acid transport system ATP-binding protein
MLSVTNVVAGYGAHDEVLKGVGIAVAERELVVLIGPNGAGKSTLLKSIAGFLKPREGTITFEGKPIGGLKPREITRQGIAFVPQEANVFPSLTIEANLEMGGYVDRAATPERLQAAYTRFPALAERRRQDARTLSGGQRQMLAMAMALMAAPRLMLLDEPSAGLSPAASAELFALVKDLHAEGMTVIMVEQRALDALEIADRGYLLVDGSNAREGNARALAADPQVRHTFLGG